VVWRLPPEIRHRLEEFTGEPLRARSRSTRSAPESFDADKKVAAAGKKLNEHGLVGPYFRTLVVPRESSALRWVQEPPSLEHVPKTMRERVARR
jgi:hypothetical protein